MALVRRLRAEAHRSTALPAVLNRVTLILNLSAFRNKALTTFLATALNDVATGLSCHAGAESVLIFARTF